MVNGGAILDRSRSFCNPHNVVVLIAIITSKHCFVAFRCGGRRQKLPRVGGRLRKNSNESYETFGTGEKPRTTKERWIGRIGAHQCCRVIIDEQRLRVSSFAPYSFPVSPPRSPHFLNRAIRANTVGTILALLPVCSSIRLLQGKVIKID
jgi:hypothetical protein